MQQNNQNGQLQKQRILFLARWFPYPPDNGSRLRIYHLLRQLANSYRVALVSFVEKEPDADAMGELANFCESVVTVPYRPFEPTRATALMGYFSLRPRSVVDTENRAFHDAVGHVVAEFDPHLIIASQIDMAVYALGFSHKLRLLEELEVTILHEAFASERRPHIRALRKLTWWKYSRYIRNLLQGFQASTTVSEPESQLVRSVTGVEAPVVVPNGVDWHGLQDDFGAPVPNTMVYAGAMTYRANFDAMAYFLREIMPSLVAQNPHVHLRITGSYRGVPVETLPLDSHVELTGYVPDIRPVVARSWVSVVPLRIGGGTRLKILESLALGTPVVTTSKGIEGLDFGPGEGVLIADSPLDFAQAIVGIHACAELRATLAARGRKAAKAYDWSVVGRKLSDLVERIFAA